MDDKQIINLFFQRDEDAINAVDEKYGSKLMHWQPICCNQERTGWNVSMTRI